MPKTVIRGAQVLDGSIQRADLDVSTVGQAVVAKLVQGTNVTLSSTGADSGTGDVTVSAAAHAATHLDNGTDPIAVVTTTRTGLTPKLNGNATTFLDGTGAFSTPAGGGNMNTSVYDTNANGVVDTCDSLAWSKLTGVPPDVTARYYGTDTGTAAALAVTVASDFTLTTGVVVYVSPANTCAASPTLNVNGSGAKAITTRGGAAGIALHAGEISTGRIFGVMYDGTQWRVTTPIGAYYIFSGTGAQNFDCNGYDAVSIHYACTSGTSATITLVNLAPGVPVSINLYNGSGAALSYAISAFKPGSVSLTTYWVFSNATTGAALVDMGVTRSLTNGNYFFVNGMIITGSLFLK
jgi:hypothetical protein